MVQAFLFFVFVLTAVVQGQACDVKLRCSVKLLSLSGVV